MKWIRKKEREKEKAKKISVRLQHSTRTASTQQHLAFLEEKPCLSQGWDQRPAPVHPAFLERLFPIYASFQKQHNGVTKLRCHLPALAQTFRHNDSPEEGRNKAALLLSQRASEKLIWGWDFHDLVGVGHLTHVKR